MGNFLFGILLFHVVYGKNLHDIGRPVKESAKKVIRQRTMEKNGRNFLVIPMMSTIIQDDSSTKTYEEAVNACKRKGGKLTTMISVESAKDAHLDNKGGDYWIGAIRNTTLNRRDPWHWVGGETTATAGLGSSQFETDGKHNCLAVNTADKDGSENTVFRDFNCEVENYVSCELDHWRQYYQAYPNSGVLEIKIKNTFIIVKDPELKNWDKAEEACSALGGGARLAQFFTYRELDLIDQNLKQINLDLINEMSEWRFWIGSQKVSHSHTGKWLTYGERIPKGFVDEEGDSGYCLLYHARVHNDENQNGEAKVERKFQWGQCDARDNTFKINGYICKMHLASTTRDI